MNKSLWLIILLFTVKIYSQQTFTKNDIYFKDELYYNGLTREPLNGTVQYFNFISDFDMEFENGHYKKATVYYNGKERIVATVYYYLNDKQVEKRVHYSKDHKKIWINCFDELGNKKLKEITENGTIIYSCPYYKNKKHGKVFYINKKGERKERVFENGKAVQSS